MEKEYIITEKQRNLIVEYLATKPYKEVANGIKIFAELPEHIEPNSE